MKKITLIWLLAFAGLISQAQTECHIKGKVIDRPESKKILIIPIDGDPRNSSQSIPIVDGEFEYTFKVEQPEIFIIAFEEEVNSGSFRPISFCAVNDTVRFTLYPSDKFSENTIIGAKENDTILEYNKYMSDLHLRKMTDINKKMNDFPREQQLNANATKVLKQLREAKDRELDSLVKKWASMQKNDEIYSAEFLVLVHEQESISKEVKAELNAYERKNASLITYSRLVTQLSEYHIGFDKTPLEDYENLLNEVYAPKYPDHRYTQMCKELIIGIKTIKVGGKYVDFTAPDLNGKMHTLSDIVDGKIAIIDLWASWCGPCRRSSMSFIPLWDEFAGDDFTIVGVAGEFKNDKSMRLAIEKDGYKWTNLLELDKRAAIWEKYGASNSGGKIILIDRDGAILAIDPDVNEIREILKQKLSRK